MKFTLNNQELLKKLQFLGGIINTNNTLPILDNFLFEFSPSEVMITASDLETTIKSTITGKFEAHNSIAIPAKLFVDVLKSFPNQPIEFEVKDNNTVAMKTITGEYEISYADGSDYPKAFILEKASTATIPASILSGAIAKTLFATGNDDLRPIMCGVYFQLSPEGIIFTSTDAHRLVKYSVDNIKSSEEATFIVPKKPLGALKGFLSSIDEDVIIEYNESNTVFKFLDYSVTVRLIEGKYPNYEAVIPKDNDKNLTIERDVLLSSVRRISTFANKHTHQVRFKVAGQELNISAEDIDYSNRGDERLSCSFEGEDIQIGFNSRFLAEALGNLQSNEIQIEMSSPVRAGVLRPVDGLEEGESLLILVMPVKLN